MGRQTAHGLAGFPKQWLPRVRMCHPSAKEPDAPCQNAVSRLEAKLAKVSREATPTNVTFDCEPKAPGPRAENGQ